MNLRLAMKSPKLFVFVLAIACGLPAKESETNEPDKAKNPALDPMLGREPGQVRGDNGLKMKFVWCPSGTFTMQDSVIKTANVNETVKLAPVEVTLSQGYWIGRYEVTQSEWIRVMDTKPWKDRQNTREGADLPAEFITWGDAQKFCRKLTDQETRAGRLPETWEYSLPTEAQWERACRAGTDSRFSFGDDESKLGDYAWYYDNSAKITGHLLHRVGQKKPNPWGLYDMHGNASEWCRDAFVDELPGGGDPEVMPDVTLRYQARVSRGGSVALMAVHCESGYHAAGMPGYANGDFGGRLGGTLGFRVALCSLPPVK